MMPVWLLRFLPHIGIALALGLAVWWINDAGYDRAMADRDARDAKMLLQFRTELRESEQRLATSIAEIGADYAAGKAARDMAFANLQTQIAKEIAREKRLSDPAAGLTPGLLDAVNRARATGACAAAASGRIECALPATEPGR